MDKQELVKIAEELAKLSAKSDVNKAFFQKLINVSKKSKPEVVVTIRFWVGKKKVPVELGEAWLKHAEAFDLQTFKELVKLTAMQIEYYKINPPS
jgi:hypothetical protein